MDETYIKIKGQWKYLYRAVDKNGQTIDFLLTAHRDKKAALRFFKKVEQDHRAIKRIVQPMMGFKSFPTARVTLQGIELMHMIKKGQMVSGDSQTLSAAGQFYSLAA